jgi:hypothetical protein
MNDLGHFLLVAVCLYGGLATLLYFLAAVDPQTDRTSPTEKAHQGRAGAGERNVTSSP